MRFFFLAVALLVTAGCPRKTTTAKAGTTQVAPTGLAGTSWRLVEFQSMDGAKGIVRPEGPAKYTMSFTADKRVAMLLNCNRASGTWTTENLPSGSASGSIKFGPLAMTKMFCPQPSMDDRIARDMDRVRSYLFKDGRLNLSLEADGGIYVWEPVSR